MKNNSFDEVYDIRRADKEDIPEIMEFIEIHWKSGHIMAHNHELFEYEYVHRDEVDFILAKKKETNSLEGIFGFLRCSLDPHGDIWGSIWKVNEDGGNMNLLGIELARRVLPLTGFRSHIGNGANPNTTVPLRKLFFREKTVKMRQFYLLNPDIEEYHIAVVNEKWSPAVEEGSPTYPVKLYSSFQDLDKEFDCLSHKAVPQKDNWYIQHRYFQHPIYKYDVYGIIDETDKTGSLLVTREVSVKASKVLRIVDYIGEHRLFAGLFRFFEKLMLDNQYEYIDFFEYGVPEQYIQSAGFVDREETSNVIPNYFEPFVRENIDIWAHYKEDGTTFFKADGDQDRPNEPEITV